MDTAKVPLTTALMPANGRTVQFTDMNTCVHHSERAYPALSDFNTDAPADTSTKPLDNFVFQYFRVQSMHVL